jgi:PAS domain S-box-containing protein
MQQDSSADPEGHARLAAIVAASSDAVICCTPDGTIDTWNPAAERLFGFSEAEVLGRPYATIVPEELADEMMERFERVASGNAVRDVETIRTRRDGARIPVIIDFAPIRRADGTISGIAATVREQRGPEARFHALLDSAPDPILGVDRDGRIVFANPQAHTVFGYGAAELIGQEVELLVPERFRTRHASVRAEYARSPTTRPMGAGLDLRARRRDGSELPVEISLSPMEVEQVVVVIVRDVSDRRLAEDERARERAEVDRLKDDLANMIVHDLKNPVNGILMTVQVLQRRMEDLTERQRRHLDGVELTCREMLRLIQNLLEIAKIEAGKLVIVHEPVDVSALARTVFGEYEPVAKQMGKRFVVRIEAGAPFVRADPGLLKRVLVNLVVNAIRHSGAREVRLDAAVASHASELTIRVRDDGSGIPAEDHERIFEKFTSARRSATGEPSADTGLGLPFCKLAVELMGGHIRLSSTPGAGTVFAVDLPLHAAAAS